MSQPMQAEHLNNKTQGSIPCGRKSILARGFLHGKSKRGVVAGLIPIRKKAFHRALKRQAPWAIQKKLNDRFMKDAVKVWKDKPQESTDFSELLKQIQENEGAE